MTTNDADDRVALWTRLLHDDLAPLLEAAIAADPPELRDVSRMRKTWSAELVHAAFELTRARARARSKFPDPSALVADIVGVEQATSHDVAAHKAKRFARAGVTAVVDLCCGIGGDAMALARVAETEVVDHDALRAWMGGRNAAAPSLCADVEGVEPKGRAMHIDPGRRNEAGQRAWHYENYQPGPETIERLLAAYRDAALKLGPGVALDALPAAGGEIELISKSGRLVQTVLYHGVLAEAPDARTATRLPDGSSFTGTPLPFPPVFGLSEDDPFDRHLLVPDPALERAQLVAALLADSPAREVFPGLGLVTTPTPLDDECAAWFTRFDVAAQMPWREERVRDWLRAHDAGIVEVKTRGSAVDVERAQKTFRGRGGTTWTVFGLRLGRALKAVVTSRVAK